MNFKYSIITIGKHIYLYVDKIMKSELSTRNIIKIDNHNLEVSFNGRTSSIRITNLNAPFSSSLLEFNEGLILVFTKLNEFLSTHVKGDLNAMVQIIKNVFNNIGR